MDTYEVWLSCTTDKRWKSTQEKMNIPLKQALPLIVKSLSSDNARMLYPIQVLEQYNFKMKQCTLCGRIFGTTSNSLQNCADHVIETSVKSDCKFTGNFTDFLMEFQDYFKNSKLEYEYEILRLPCIRNPFGKNLNYTVSGVNSYTPGYLRETNQSLHTESYADVQFCLRFEDFMQNTTRHYIGFNMAGQHIIQHKQYRFGSGWKRLALRDLLKYLVEKLGIEFCDLTVHLDFWADGAINGNLGPCIEFFTGGIEVANQVYMEFHYQDGILRDLPFRMVDMGAGMERLYHVVSGRLVEEQIGLNKINFDLTRAAVHMINSGITPSKTGVGYNLRRILGILKANSTDIQLVIQVTNSINKLSPLLAYYGYNVQESINRVMGVIRYESGTD